MTEERFAQIYDELQRADCTCEMSAFLSVLPDHELKTVFEVFLDQYGQELAAGALEIRLVVWNADNQRKPIIDLFLVGGSPCNEGRNGAEKDGKRFSGRWTSFVTGNSETGYHGAAQALSIAAFNGACAAPREVVM
jgi:hypothetical protein